ncbi:MAG: D-alanine--D-alanine ligase [Cyanobacteria bacterium P01_H01_bin.74]
MPDLISSTRSTINISHNTKIAVLYGGLSSERSVSLRSGKNCYEALKRLGYSESVLIDVDHTVSEQLQQHQIDLAFIMLHGKYGEDGCIQGLLATMGIPYTGCSLTANAICIDKALTKKLLTTADLPLIQSMEITATDWQNKAKEWTGKIQAHVGYPVMVKPLCEGSSVGMSKVDAQENLEEALLSAFKYSNEVMLERYVSGKSLTVGVLEISGQLKATPILELRPNCATWYDYESKYTDGGTTFVLPAEISEEATLAIQEASISAFQTVNCTGVARVDFVYNSTANGFYILEINTIPGMTEVSDLPAQASAMGIEYDQLVEIILFSAAKPRH